MRRSKHRQTMTESLDMDSPMWIGTMCGAGITASVRKFAQPSLKKSPLRFLLREAQGSFVGGAGFRRLPEPTAEICPRRVDQMIVP